MKKTIYIISLVCCIMFTCCKKEGGGMTAGEDLSYLIKTYYRYESGNQIIKQIWTYDRYKMTGNKYYVDGQLYQERKNFSYNELRASYDSYSYRNGDANDVSVTHYEYEYLDNTYQRTKHVRYYYPNAENDNIYETYYEYDGNKRLGYKSYTNGVLTNEVRYTYNGLRCSYKTTNYYSENVVRQERDYEILYLDETYLREKSRLQTRKRYDTEGNLTSSDTYYTVNEYDGTKPVGYQSYTNGKLSAVGRDYQYDGLTCFYFIDSYNNNGEVVSTRMYEVEYLE